MDMFQVLARTMEHWVSDFTPQGLANTSWAFARIEEADTKLFVAFARAAEMRMHAFDA